MESTSSEVCRWLVRRRRESRANIGWRVVITAKSWGGRNYIPYRVSLVARTVSGRSEGVAMKRAR
jgi:hypothetical protein